MEYAWICAGYGCTHKVPITRRGHSVYVPHPSGKRAFRVDADQFDSGAETWRQPKMLTASWRIARWCEQAQRELDRQRSRDDAD